MMIEPFSPYIDKLRLAEPWRSSQSSAEVLCDGAIDFDGSRYWCCQACGKIGTASVQIHYPVRNPLQFLKDLIQRVVRRNR